MSSKSGCAKRCCGRAAGTNEADNFTAETPRRRDAETPRRLETQFRVKTCARPQRGTSAAHGTGGWRPQGFEAVGSGSSVATGSQMAVGDSGERKMVWVALT